MGLLAKIRGAVAGAAQGFQSSLGWGGAYSETVGWSADRSNVMYWTPADSRQHLPRWTRVQINGKVEWLFQNFGVVKEGVRGITRHTMGRGRFLQLNCEDTEWNELAELDWETYALAKDRCDLAGRRNFYDYQNLAGWQRLKQGEFLGAFAANPRWQDEVCVQAFDAAEVRNPDGKDEKDRIFDGVELDGNNAAVVYYVAAAGGVTKPIPATEMIHWHSMDGVNDVRGVSEFAQAVNPLIDIKDLIKVTTKSGKLHGAMALLVKRAAKIGGLGAIGAIKKLGERPGSAPPPTNGGSCPPTEGARQIGGPALEQVFSGGAIMYVDDDNDVKLVNSTQPSPLVEPFVTDLLMRDVCCGWGVDPQFFWAMAKVGAGAMRAIFVKADLFFTVFGDGVDTELNTPWAVRYLQGRMDSGHLRKSTDKNWMQKMGWQGPPKLTVDDGRTGALEIAQLAAGVQTMQSLNDLRGRNWRPQTQQWFREWAFAFKCATAAGVPWALKFWRTAQPGAIGGTSGETDQELENGKTDPEDDDDAPADAPPNDKGDKGKGKK